MLVIWNAIVLIMTSPNVIHASETDLVDVELISDILKHSLFL